jgi:hypothetical protein
MPIQIQMKEWDTLIFCGAALVRILQPRREGVAFTGVLFESLEPTPIFPK